MSARAIHLSKERLEKGLSLKRKMAAGPKFRDQRDREHRYGDTLLLILGAEVTGQQQ